MSARIETEVAWSAAMDATLKAEKEAQQALQRAIDARWHELMLEAKFHSEAGNQRASRLAAYKARFIGRTNVRVLVMPRQMLASGDASWACASFQSRERSDDEVKQRWEFLLPRKTLQGRQWLELHENGELAAPTRGIDLRRCWC
jgi:hypothetical protein